MRPSRHPHCREMLSIANMCFAMWAFQKPMKNKEKVAHDQPTQVGPTK